MPSFLETPDKSVKMWLDEHSIVQTLVAKDAYLNLEHVKRTVDFRYELQQGKRTGLLIDLRGIKGISVEARHYVSSHASADQLYGIALLFSNTISRMIASMALGINKPEATTKVFSNRDRAMAWLFEQAHQ